MAEERSTYSMAVEGHLESLKFVEEKVPSLSVVIEKALSTASGTREEKARTAIIGKKTSRVSGTIEEKPAPAFSKARRSIETASVNADMPKPRIIEFLSSVLLSFRNKLPLWFSIA